VEAVDGEAGPAGECFWRESASTSGSEDDRRRGRPGGRALLAGEGFYQR